MENGMIADDAVAAVYYAGPSYDSSLSGTLFIWITLTMAWVIMILAAMALVKYITHEGSNKGVTRRAR